jgi:uncharacterized damage-inducible protein DinB
MPHPLVPQLRFTRAELLRGLAGVSDEDAQRRLLPMNCISWMVGHLAWQEQRYFLTFAQGQLLVPELNAQFAYGAPACTPPLAEVRATWQAVTAAADLWLEQTTAEGLLQTYTTPNGAWTTSYGNLLQRVIYHYWFHIGEILAIRQQLGHRDLPEFVGDIDGEAPFQTA